LNLVTLFLCIASILRSRAATQRAIRLISRLAIHIQRQVIYSDRLR
jgi:hypothetical protein